MREHRPIVGVPGSLRRRLAGGPGREPPKAGARATGWIWLPVPLLLAATVALMALDPLETHDSTRWLLICNFVFLTLTSLLVADLMGRTFAIRGASGLLFLEAGMVVWGIGGLVSAIGGRDPNVVVTIHDSCAVIAAACQLAGVGLWLARPRRVQTPAVWAPATFLLALTVVAGTALAVHEGWTPPFFTQGAGGTLLRDMVLSAACFLLLLAAFLLQLVQGSIPAAFARWYAPALALIAVGLLGAVAQPSLGSWQGWVARGAQYMGGLYMLVAALAAVREARAWGTSVALELRDTERRYEALFTTSLDAILLSDEHGALVAANPAACALFGRTEAELCRMGRAGLAAPGTDLGAFLQERARTGAARAEVDLVRADGSLLRAELSSVVFDRRGRAFDLVRDVTEQRSAEAALREADRRKDEFL